MTKEWEQLQDEMNPTWNGKDNPLTEGDELVGILKGVEYEVGPNDSTMYTLEARDGVWGVWGSAILDTRLKNADTGDEIKIVYNGYKKSEKTGREYKDYTVFKRKPVISEEEL